MGQNVLVRDNINGYTGLYAFHKYWGKKPAEILRYLVQNLSEPGAVVLDPFVGCGVLAREAVTGGRQFVGIDVNPAAIQIAKLMVNPPPARALELALGELSAKVTPHIQKTYRLENSGIATHYLWNEDVLSSVWTKDKGRKRTELTPTPHDEDLASEYSGYKSKNIRAMKFFDNSRINAKKELSIEDLFTGRAIHNIDLILDFIMQAAPEVQDALKVCLTSSVGQMSNMVFAITGRGKTTGKASTKIEVGSWVIGYWRPKVHFEVNAWNCFDRRATKLLNALNGDPHDLISNGNPSGDARLIVGDAIENLRAMDSDSVDLIVTDPPHSDRIPYLELSELWNAILNHDVCFDKEIVVSNAKARAKDISKYQSNLKSALSECMRVLKPGGKMVILFNARDDEAWCPLKDALNGDSARNVNYVGSFESHYSAGSVVQDNRAGGLQHDFGIVFQKGKQNTAHDRGLAMLPGWTTVWPEESFAHAV